MKQAYAKHYRIIEDKHWWFQGRQAILESICKRYINPPARILDIGCGIGNILKALSSLGDCYGMDHDRTMIDYARKRGLNISWGSLPIHFHAFNLFDVILLFDVLEHCDEEALALKNIKFHLKSDGLFILTVPAYQWLWSSHDVVNEHKRRYTRGSLIRLLKKNGFKIWESTYFNTLLFPLVILGKFFFRHKDGHIEIPHLVINSMLKKIFKLEAKILKYLSFPFGGSILIVCSK